MGAATALMYGDRDPSIACMVLDSSFSSLVRLAEDMVEKGKEAGMVSTSTPKFLVNMAIRFIKSSVQSRAGFNIRDISPISVRKKRRMNEHEDQSFSFFLSFVLMCFDFIYIFERVQ
jgi:hypothetical protein